MTGQRRRYPRILSGIVIAYGLIIALADSVAGGVGRLLLFGFLFREASHLKDPPPRWPRLAVWIGTGLGMGSVIVAAALAPTAVTSGLVGGVSLVLTAAVIGLLGRALLARRAVDTPTVLGVLSVYLLLALFFASLNQLLTAFDTAGYLNGVAGLPSSADQLYFSVITLATVGYGDLTPASQVARGVAVVEALAGQVYLVSVVAAVVGGWNRRP